MFTAIKFTASGSSVVTRAISMGYYVSASDSLKVLHCSTLECTASTNTVADNTSASGQWPTIIAGNDGNPLVFFEDRNKTTLRMVKCLDVSCTTSLSKILVPGGVVGRNNVVAIRSDGTPVVLYERVDVQELNLLSCANRSVSHAVVDTPFKRL